MCVGDEPPSRQFYNKNIEATDSCEAIASLFIIDYAGDNKVGSFR